MSYLEYQFEVLRGQLEELQGTLEETLAIRRGRGGIFGSVRGRSRRVRGKTRQAVARAKHGTLGFGPRLNIPGLPGRQQPTPPSTTRYVLLAAGVVLVVTALLWPGLLSSLWKQIDEMMAGPADRQNASQTSSEL